MKHAAPPVATRPSARRPAAALTFLLLLGGCTAATDSPTPSAAAVASNAAKTTPSAAPPPSAAATPTASIEPEVAALLPPIDTHVTKDIDRWTLPTDPYDTARLLAINVYLGHLEQEKCMADAGFPEFTHNSNAFAPAPDGFKPDLSTPLFNQHTAAKYGYRTPPDPRFPVSEDARQAYMQGRDRYEQESPEFKEAFDTCGALGLERLLGGAPTADGQQPPAEEAADEAPAASNSERPAPEAEAADGPGMGPPTELEVDVTRGELPAAAERWRTCMAPLQIPDLPNHPWSEMWTEIPQSLRERWDWTHTFTASEDELRVATHDADCRVSSGWHQAYYDAEWDLHQKYLDNYRTALESRIAKVRVAEVEAVREILKLEAKLPDR